jgi:hypothetical protein
MFVYEIVCGRKFKFPVAPPPLPIYDGIDTDPKLFIFIFIFMFILLFKLAKLLKLRLLFY